MLNILIDYIIDYVLNNLCSTLVSKPPKNSDFATKRNIGLGIFAFCDNTIKKIYQVFFSYSNAKNNDQSHEYSGISEVVKRDCKNANIRKRYWVMRIKTPKK